MGVLAFQGPFGALHLCLTTDCFGGCQFLETQEGLHGGGAWCLQHPGSLLETLTPGHLPLYTP